MNIDDKIMEELKALDQPVGVISTVNEEGRPESASMYYIYDNAFNVFFITRIGSRKYKNLEKNPHASFVITSENPPRTIQLEGTAKRVLDAHEESEHFAKLVKMASDHITMPPVSQVDGSEIVFMKLSPDWVRFGNFECIKEGNKFIEAHIL